MSTALTEKLLPQNAAESYTNRSTDEAKDETENNNNLSQEEAMNDIEHSKEGQKVQQAVIKEETINTTTKLIISSLAWTNATLLYSALESSFYISDWTNLSNSWSIFCISLIIALVVIMIPLYCWIDVQSDKFKQQFIYDNTDMYKESEQDMNDKSPFFAKFEYLLLAATSFTVSMSMRDASKLTFQQKVIERNNIESAAYILYAIFWTIIGVWSTIHLTNKQNKYKKDIIEHGVVDIDTKILTHFAIKQRYISLIILTITYIMAWSWRTAIDSFVLGMYGGDKLTTAHVWIYCITVSLSISFLVSLSDHFYCLYPKAIEAQGLFTKSRTVEETNKLVYDNCKFVIGFAWHAAIRVTVFFNSTKSIVFNVFVLYWSVAILMVFISIYATHKFTQKKIERTIDAIGFQKWIQKTKDTLQHVVSRRNPKTTSAKELTYTQYEVPRLCHTFSITAISLTSECWSIAGSLFIGDAVHYSILAIYYSINEYSIELEYEHMTTGLWLQWTAVVIILCITALIMLYLRKTMTLLRHETHVLTKKIKTLISQIHHH